jgi:hypothetical protein
MYINRNGICYCISISVLVHKNTGLRHETITLKLRLKFFVSMYIHILGVMCTDVSSVGLTRNIFTFFVFIEKTFHKTENFLRPVLIIFGSTKPNNRQNESNDLILCIA